MAKRYDQYCPIAHALSLVGERWSLLVVRELLKGPRRYTDLAGGLPGIGTNILATRLRELEAGGVVHKRRLPPPAASTVYELTEYGAGLEEAIYAIARWGARSLGPAGERRASIPSGASTPSRRCSIPERARGPDRDVRHRRRRVDVHRAARGRQPHGRARRGRRRGPRGAHGHADAVRARVRRRPDPRGGRAGPRRPPAGRRRNARAVLPRLQLRLARRDPAGRRDEARLGPRVRVETAIPVA